MSYAGQVLTGRTLHFLTTHAQKAVLRRDGGVSSRRTGGRFVIVYGRAQSTRRTLQTYIRSYVNYVSINLEKMKINIKNKEQSARLWRTRFAAVTLTS